MGTSGVHKFHFTSESAQASHVALEHLDYDHTADAFLLDCAFTNHGKHPQVVVGGVLGRDQRSYSPTEIRSMQTVGLAQSPAYFCRRVHTASRIPSRLSSHSRTDPCSNQDP